MTPRDRVLQAIAAHIGESEKAGRAPVHILYGELRASLPDMTDRQLRDTLNALWSEKAIGTGRTINDTYITLNDKENAL